MDARVHIYTATALGRGRVVSPTLSRIYSQGKSLVLIFIGTPEPVWTLRSEKNISEEHHKEKATEVDGTEIKAEEAQAKKVYPIRLQIQLNPEWRMIN